MAFNSIGFLLCFLPVFFLVYGIISDKYKNFVLLAGSLVFYSMGDVRGLPVLLLSVILNYYVGPHLRVTRKIKKRTKTKKYIHQRKWLLFLAVAANIGLLLALKSDKVGYGLPLGMSFYTFQVLSYLIDVYRGDVPAEKFFLRFAVYLLMFPRITSGPIVRYDQVAGDLAKRKITPGMVQSGLELLTVGLSLKVLLADPVGILWNSVQTIGFESISLPLSWMGAVAYSLKLYLDFYGYSLMAIGLGTMLGFSLPANFREPYMATSVRDFYRRWHITLGDWFRRYVYIPLGGSRAGELRTIGNLLAVWLLTALWHGYTANFLVWGMLLCGLIILERMFQKAAEHIFSKGKSGRKRRHLLPHLYVCAVIPVTWMCFAITDMSQLLIYLGRMFGVAPQAVVRSGDWIQALQDYGILLAAAAAVSLPFGRKLYSRWKDNIVCKALLAVLFWVCIWRITREGNNPFLYLRF